MLQRSDEIRPEQASQLMREILTDLHDIFLQQMRALSA